MTLQNRTRPLLIDNIESFMRPKHQCHQRREWCLRVFYNLTRLAETSNNPATSGLTPRPAKKPTKFFDHRTMATGMGVCVLPVTQAHIVVPRAPGYDRWRPSPPHHWRAAVTSGMRSQPGSSVILKILDYSDNGNRHDAMQYLASLLFGRADVNTWKRLFVTLPHSMQ